MNNKTRISESSNITADRGSMLDDGPRFFYGNQRTYRTTTEDMATRLGFEVVNYLVGDEEFEVHDTDYPNGPPGSTTYFPVGLAGVYGVGTNYYRDLKGQEAFDKWSKDIMRTAQIVGYKFISFLGAEKSIGSSKDEPMSETGTNIVEEGLVQHANDELRLAGLFDEDSDYNGMIAKATLELIEKFAEQGLGISFLKSRPKKQPSKEQAGLRVREVLGKIVPMLRARAVEKKAGSAVIHTFKLPDGINYSGRNRILYVGELVSAHAEPTKVRNHYGKPPNKFADELKRGWDKNTEFIDQLTVIDLLFIKDSIRKHILEG